MLTGINFSALDFKMCLEPMKIPKIAKYLNINFSKKMLDMNIFVKSIIQQKLSTGGKPQDGQSQRLNLKIKKSQVVLNRKQNKTGQKTQKQNMSFENQVSWTQFSFPVANCIK